MRFVNPGEVQAYGDLRTGRDLDLAGLGFAPWKLPDLFLAAYPQFQIEATGVDIETLRNAYGVPWATQSTAGARAESGKPTHLAIFDGNDFYQGANFKPPAFTFVADLSYANTNQMNVMASVNSDGNSTTHCGLLANVNVAGGANRIGLVFSNGTGWNYSYAGDFTGAANVRQFVAGRFSEGVLSFRINGTNRTVTAGSTSGAPSTNAGTAAQFAVGRFGENNGGYFAGTIWGADVFSRALSDDECDQILDWHVANLGLVV